MYYLHFIHKQFIWLGTLIRTRGDKLVRIHRVRDRANLVLPCQSFYVFLRTLCRIYASLFFHVHPHGYVVRIDLYLLHLTLSQGTHNNLVNLPLFTRTSFHPWWIFLENTICSLLKYTI